MFCKINGERNCQELHLSTCIQLRMTKHLSGKAMKFRHLLGCDTIVCDDSEMLRMLPEVLLLIGYWCLNRYVNCFTLDWNQLAFAVPETVIKFIVGRCF